MKHCCVNRALKEHSTTSFRVRGGCGSVVQSSLNWWLLQIKHCIYTNFLSEWPLCKRLIFPVSVHTLTAMRESRGVVQGQGQNKLSVSKWRQCHINTLVTELVDFDDTSNFPQTGKWKTKTQAFVSKLAVECYKWCKDLECVHGSDHHVIRS